MAHDLRRLRLHGLIERIPRYRVTARGIRVALCYQRPYACVLRPAGCDVRRRSTAQQPPARKVEAFDREIDRL
ncbi:MAG: hypothetical protein OXH96_16410 [Spirochaetaceae bacterium]|nr:hypothetical protein [Spirochaetaceae bacterium]